MRRVRERASERMQARGFAGDDGGGDIGNACVRSLAR